jgi:DUF971 family protein
LNLVRVISKGAFAPRSAKVSQPASTQTEHPDMAPARPRPTELKLDRSQRVLQVSFDTGECFQLSCEYLRVHSPSAEVQGHSPEQRVLQTGKSQVNIQAIHPVGHYAVVLDFDDGHATGIYTWTHLYDLGRNQDERWKRYLDELERASASRDP